MKFKLIRLNEAEYNKLLNEAATIEKAYTGYENKISPEDFQKLIQADPTYKPSKPNYAGKLFKWILNAYEADNSILGNLPKVQEDMAFFVQNHNMVGSKKITDFPTYNDLHTFVNQLKGETDDETLGGISNPEVRQGTNVLYNSSDWMVINPTNYEASRYWGEDTTWCTAAGENGRYDGRRMFQQYSNDGPLLININKQNGEKFQFHFETESYMDANDEPIHKPIVDHTNMPEDVLEFYQEQFPDYADRLEKQGYEVQEELPTGLKIVSDASISQYSDENAYNIELPDGSLLFDENCEYIHTQGDLIIVEDYYTSGFYSATGQNITPDFLDGTSYSISRDGTVMDDENNEYVYVIVSKGNKYYIMGLNNDDTEQLMVCDETFEDITPATNQGDHYFIVTKGGKQGVLDLLTFEVIDNLYFDQVKCFAYEECFLGMNNRKTTLVYYEDGSMLGDGQVWYDRISMPQNGVCQAQLDGKMTWIQDRTGQPLFEDAWYLSVDYFYDGFSRVKIADEQYSFARQEDGQLFDGGKMIFPSCPSAPINGCTYVHLDGSYVGMGHNMIYDLNERQVVFQSDLPNDISFQQRKSTYTIHTEYTDRKNLKGAQYNSQTKEWFIDTLGNKEPLRGWKQVTQQEAYQYLNGTTNESINKLVNVITEQIIKQTKRGRL